LISHQTFATAPGAYEFDALESRTIETIAGRTRLWGIISLVLGIALTIGLAVLLTLADRLAAQIPILYIHTGIGAMVPVMIVHFAVAVLYIGSGNALMRCVQTQGSDLEHLLAGLAKMGVAFKVEFFVSVIATVVGLGVGFVVLPNL
jgi:hypothetical protein